MEGGNCDAFAVRGFARWLTYFGTSHVIVNHGVQCSQGTFHDSIGNSGKGANLVNFGCHYLSTFQVSQESGGNVRFFDGGVLGVEGLFIWVLVNGESAWVSVIFFYLFFRNVHGVGVREVLLYWW